MGYIRSPNPDFAEVPVPSSGVPYVHPVDRRGGAIPMAFQVTSPFNRFVCLLPHALVLHVNPTSLQEMSNQKIERFQTRGGWVEQHWGHDLLQISADATTGAFMNIHTGLTSVLRQRTIAWDRYRDLHDLYRHNGSVYDPQGNIVLQGHIMLMYDRGIYIGTFRSFEMEETDESPFSFRLAWSFKVEQTIMAVDLSTTFRTFGRPAPRFQSLNTAPLPPTNEAVEETEGERRREEIRDLQVQGVLP